MHFKAVSEQTVLPSLVDTLVSWPSSGSEFEALAKFVTNCGQGARIYVTSGSRRHQLVMNSNRSSDGYFKASKKRLPNVGAFAAIFDGSISASSSAECLTDFV